MNIIEQYRIENIIIEVAKQNPEIDINSIKRKIKEEIRVKMENPTLASKVGVDYIMGVISKNRKFIFEQEVRKPILRNTMTDKYKEGEEK